MNFAELSSAELRVYRAVLDFTSSRGYPPGVKELAEFLELTHPAVSYHAKTLRDRGFLAKTVRRALIPSELAATLSEHAERMLTVTPVPQRTRHDPR